MAPVLVPVAADAFVAVDCWRPRPPRGSCVAAFFLTHAHADHMAGLHDGWSFDGFSGGGRNNTSTSSPPLFCSPETRAILEGMGLRRLARRFAVFGPGGRVLITRKGRSSGDEDDEEEAEERERMRRRKKRRKEEEETVVAKGMRMVFVEGVGVALLPSEGGEEEEPESEEEEPEEKEEEEEEEEVVATVDALDAQHCVVSLFFFLFSISGFSSPPFTTSRPRNRKKKIKLLLLSRAR